MKCEFRDIFIKRNVQLSDTTEHVPHYDTQNASTYDQLFLMETKTESYLFMRYG